MTEFLRRIWTFSKPYQSRLMLGLLCGVLYALANASLMVAVRVIINLVFSTPGETSLAEQLRSAPAFLRPLLDALVALVPQRTSNTGLAVAIATLPVIMALRSLFSYLNFYLMNWAAARTVADLRVKLFGHLQNLSLGFFNRASTGDLISRVTNDTATLHQTITSSISSLGKDPLVVLILLAALLVQHPTLTGISMLVFPACLVPIVIYGRKVRRSVRSMQNHLAELSSLMHESFTGNRIIKAYNLEDTVLAQFRETTRKVVGHFMRVARANDLPGQLTEAFGAIGVALVFYYVAFFTDRSMKAGDFLFFVGSIFMMYQPIKALTRVHNQLEQSRAASARVFELLDTASTIVEPAQPRALRAAGAAIEFDQVDFDYGEKPVLRDINLTVKAGELVALVGSSGAGKTTLTNLLLRFYDPTRGVVRIGGTDLREVALRDLRGQVAVVTQETILFNDTIRRNIAFGRPGATDAEIEAVARRVHAHEFILQKEAGYDTIVGERGVAVSGGQRQRLAIARALLKNAPILILDEATNALDSESERAVQTELEELMKGRTTFCIAHRLSTIVKADRILVFDQGRIVEGGRHEELLQRGGVYRKLYELQFHTEEK